MTAVANAAAAEKYGDSHPQVALVRASATSKSATVPKSLRPVSCSAAARTWQTNSETLVTVAQTAPGIGEGSIRYTQ